jgi:multidrug efflux pump subunit AcrA (membrane-fusion protein)
MTLIPETVCQFTWRGRRSWLYSDGTILPVISGGDGDDPDPKDPPDPADDGDKKFSQADLNRLLAREKNDGKRAGQSELLQALGVNNLDEAKEIIAARKAAEDAALSDADKARKEAEREKAEAATAKAEAAREKLDSRIERALVRAHIPDDQIELVARMVVVEDGADQDKVNDAVEDLKKKMPQLFEEPDPNRAPDPAKPPGSNPGRPPRGGAPTPTPAEAAQAVFAARHPGKVKTK